MTKEELKNITQSAISIRDEAARTDVELINMDNFENVLKMTAEKGLDFVNISFYNILLGIGQNPNYIPNPSPHLFSELLCTKLKEKYPDLNIYNGDGDITIDWSK